MMAGTAHRPRVLGNIALVLSLAAGLCPKTVSAQPIKINVHGANFRPYPMAVPIATLISGKGKKNKQLIRDVTATLQQGVDLVRALELVPPRSYLAPSKESWAKPVYENWVNVGASGLVRCGVEVAKDEVRIGFRFYNVIAQREELHRSYAVSADKAGTAVNQFIDALIEHLTGEKGLFSSRIAYVKRTKGGKAIFLSDITGQNVDRITDDKQLSLLPAWDPTGKHVLFTSYLKGNPDLFRLNLGTKKIEWLSNRRGLNTGAAVSPDGKKIALTLSLDGNTEIYVMDNQGKNLTRLTDSWGQDVSPSWSPDGKRLAFVSSRSGQPHIYIMDVDGSAPRRLTFQGSYNQEPNWSPRADGQIAFTARDEFLKYDIFLVHPDSGAISRLTQDEGNNESPFHSPDGQHLVFTSTRKPQRGKKLYVMDIDGRNQRRISKTAGDYETPSWGPRLGY